MKNQKLQIIIHGYSSGSDIDRILYAVEDIAIHTISMILKSEGKNLDNTQYRTYTSEWLYRNGLNFKCNFKN